MCPFICYDIYFNEWNGKSRIVWSKNTVCKTWNHLLLCQASPCWNDGRRTTTTPPQNTNIDISACQMRTIAGFRWTWLFWRQFTFQFGENVSIAFRVVQCHANFYWPIKCYKKKNQFRRRIQFEKRILRLVYFFYFFLYIFANSEYARKSIHSHTHNTHMILLPFCFASNASIFERCLEILRSKREKTQK